MAEPKATLLDDSMDTDPGASRSGHRLLVFSEEGLTTYDLADGGEMVIGRADDCEIQFDLPALSRRHALIKVGPPLTVEDLGSVNGTRLRGEKLPPNKASPLRSGDAIEVGPLTIVVQRPQHSEPNQRQRRLWTHAYFEGRLEEECGRAEISGQPFALLRLKLEGAASPSLVQDALARLSSPTDLVASYGPGEYEALIFSGRHDALARQMKDELSKAGAPVRTGVAVWGRDGKDPDALLEAANLKVDPPPREETPGVIVRDPQMEALHALVKRVAQGDIAVLLLGETGVGKEVFAEAIHRQSPRRNGPFLRLNCAAFTETLLESELFGHEKGAFTGAVRTKIGLLESASGGTVLLDEVGEMPQSTQAKLLRVLEVKEVMRVGDVKTRPIDVRFIAATHRDLEAKVEMGSFRQDLYYRLNGISLVIPPLRERPGELESLARHFITRASKQFGRPEPTLTPGALDLLKSYAWPGNLRELRNVMERAVLLSERTIDVHELPVEKLTATVLSRGAQGPGSAPSGEPESERARIIAALESNGGNQTLAAKALGISRRTMLNKLDALAIPRPRKGK
ncbi:MAG: sigma 54-interacting transcriptional regulator [Myxococcaceae bacterium]